MFLAIARPRPVPARRVVKYGSKMRGRSSSAMPAPVSRMVIAARRSPIFCVISVTAALGRPSTAWSALVSRLTRTVRSRSLAVYLGAIERPDPERVRTVTTAFRRAVESFAAGRSAIHLLAAADALYRSAEWDDPRDARPFAMAASVVMEAYRAEPERGVKAPAAALLALAEALLLAPETRSRNIAAQRILEGLVSKHLVAS